MNHSIFLSLFISKCCFFLNIRQYKKCDILGNLWGLTPSKTVTNIKILTIITGQKNDCQILLPENCWLSFFINKKKSQNCVKAAIAFVCTTCKIQLLFAIVQTKVIFCNSAIKSCLLQVVHTKAIAALMQFCDFSSTI